MAETKPPEGTKPPEQPKTAAKAAPKAGQLVRHRYGPKGGERERVGLVVSGKPLRVVWLGEAHPADHLDLEAAD
jgi:hypothetical protein